MLSGVWDIVGGHVEAGETIEEALAREINEETGWSLRGIGIQIADWQWEHDGILRRELDFLVDVEGDLIVPRLEEGKHDAYAWIGIDGLELMMEGRTDGDCRLRNIVAKALQLRSSRVGIQPQNTRFARCRLLCVVAIRRVALYEGAVSGQLQVLWPALAAMEHRDDLRTLAAHSVRNDVPCTWHHELTSTGDPTGPPQIR